MNSNYYKKYLKYKNKYIQLAMGGAGDNTILSTKEEDPHETEENLRGSNNIKKTILSSKEMSEENLRGSNNIKKTILSSKEMSEEMSNNRHYKKYYYKEIQIGLDIYYVKKNLTKNEYNDIKLIIENPEGKFNIIKYNVNPTQYDMYILKEDSREVINPLENVRVGNTMLSSKEMSKEMSKNGDLRLYDYKEIQIGSDYYYVKKKLTDDKEYRTIQNFIENSNGKFNTIGYTKSKQTGTYYLND